MPGGCAFHIQPKSSHVERGLIKFFFVFVLFQWRKKARSTPGAWLRRGRNPSGYS